MLTEKMARRRFIPSTGSASRRLGLDEYRGLLERTQTFVDDTRVCREGLHGQIQETPLKSSQRFALSIVQFERSRDYITEKQRDSLVAPVAEYEAVAALNEGFEPGFRDGVAGLFRELSGLAQSVLDDREVPYRPLRHELQIRQRNLDSNTLKIEGGELFWAWHFRPAMRVLESIESLASVPDLDEKHLVDLGDLPDRLNMARDRSFLDNSKPAGE